MKRYNERRRGTRNREQFLAATTRFWRCCGDCLPALMLLLTCGWPAFAGQPTPPTISHISDQRTFPGLPTRTLGFTIGDAQTAATNLVLSAGSTNLTLLPLTNIVFGGTGSNRTVTLTPAAGQKGQTQVTLTVTDEKAESASDSFGLTVADFTAVNAGFWGLSLGNVTWADYDNDMDLDALISGFSSSGGLTALYRNDGGGVFTYVYSPFPNLEYSAAAWGDYDNDGDLDLLISGEYRGTSTATTQIYRNEGNGSFSYVTSLAGVFFGSVTWTDVDNDGDLDALLGGRYEMYVYRNEGNGVFTNTSAAFPSGYYSYAAWADYDNDGDLDIAASTTASGAASPNVTRIFRQDGPGVFTPVALFPYRQFTCAAWGDYDNDGDLDLLMIGGDPAAGAFAKVYRNDGGDTFSELPVSLPGAGYSAVAWGDYDNDGRLDILLSGGSLTRIYRNQGGDNFSLSWAAPEELDQTSVAWGDFDNDGDLDILVMGVTNGVKSTTLYRNDGAMPNTPPSAPANLVAQPNGISARLAWTAATDAEQPSGLSYNVRLSTSPGTANRMPPGADLATGWRRLPALGNAGERLFYTITNLSAGTYYWSVQAIDHAFAGSVFAAEQSFTITLPVVTNQPQPQTLFAGQTATFTVGASGTPPLAYQWRFNGTNIAGATDSALVLTNAQFLQQGLYSVIVTDVVGQAVSSNALLTVNSAPVITTQPRGQTVAFGSPATFSVSVIGSEPFGYQWLFEGVEVPDATSATLALPAVQFTNAGNYSVRVTNWVGSTTSLNAQMNVYPLGLGLQSISVPAAVDMVYDDARDIMYISSGNSVLRYSVGSNTFLTPFQMGTALAGLDLSPDGNTLVVGDHNGGSTEVWVYFIDLLTGQSRQVLFPRLWESGIYWVTYGNDGAVVTTSDWTGGSGSDQVRRYDPITDTTSIIGMLSEQSRPTASGDGSVIAIGEGSASSGRVYKYDVATRQIVATGQYNQFSWIHPGVNRNGTQFTYSMDHATYVLNSNLSQVIYTFGGAYLGPRPVAVVYHPAQDLMFLAWGGSSQVRLYETTNFTEVARYEFGYSFGTGERTTCRMRISRDGSLVMARVGGDGINSIGGGINYLRWPTAPPVITSHPASTHAFMGSNVTFSVQVGGTPPFSYQWRFLGEPLAGATNSLLSLTNLQPTQQGTYDVLVSNSGGSVTSSVVTLTLDGAPVITAQPTNLTIFAGDSAALTVTAVGTTPFSYQWLLFGTNFGGPNAATFSLADAQTANAGDYSVIVNNTYGSATSSVATLTVASTVPIITLQPQTQDVPAGNNLSLTAGAKGTEPLYYQWRFKDADLPGQTTTSLALANMQDPNTGDYTVTVSNSVGITTSAVAVVTVTPAGPTITTFPVSRSAPRGAEVLFSAAAKGTEPLAFQWRFGISNLPGETNTTLTLVNVQSNDVGTYSVLITNTAGATAASATLSLSAPPGFLWARSGGGGGTDMGNCAAMDAADNVYVAGSFASSASFGGSNLVSVGSWDVFVAKYDPLGQLLWVRQAGGTAIDAAAGIALDPAGNVFVTGSLEGTADFGGVTLTNLGYADIFVAKYDSNGALLWVTNAGGSSNDQGYGIATDPAGNALVCGSFSGTATFGGTNLTSAGNLDGFLACYTGDGDVAWARRVGGTSADMGRAIACDRSGNSYLVGDFFSLTLAIGSVVFTNTSPASGYSDLFLARYDPAGTFQWAAQVTGSNSENARGIAADDAGNVFLAGYYAGTPVFGSLAALTNAGNSDLFVAKYDPAGNALWARGAGGSGNDHGYALAVDAGGNAFVTGRLNYTVKFGATNSFGSSGDDAFVAMYTAAGNIQWVRRTSGSALDYGLGICANNTGQVYLGGVSQGAATFGHVTPTPFGGSDVFLAKLASYDSSAAPVFTLHPSNQVAQAGANVTFNLGFIGAGPVACQWLFNGTNITDATNAFLTVSNATTAQAGSYSAVVSNANGAATTAAAMLTVSVEPDFFWALRAGGGGNDETLAVTADADGNTYAAGYFSGTADFDATNLASYGGEDIFVAKYDSAQNLLWVRQAGGSGTDRANALALDDTGTNIIVAGHFSGTASFGGFNRTSQGGTDLFAALYDGNGKVRWAQAGGGSGDDTALGLCATPNRRFLMTGSFHGSAAIGGAVLNSAGSNDVFVVKYSTLGIASWAVRGGGTGDDWGRTVTCDPAGNVYVAGGFSLTANFGGTNLVSTALLDVFLVKYDSNGNRIWARRAGTSTAPPANGPYNDEAYALAADPDGNILVSGYFQSQATFGTSVLTANLTNQSDAFLAKYDTTGNVLWAKPAGGALGDFGKALATDLGGNAFLAGSFKGTAQFNPFTASSVGSADMFVAMYDATGRLVKVRRGGGVGDDAGQAVAVDGRGNALIAGSHAAPAAFGDTALANVGGLDAFVTKVSFFPPDEPPLITSQPQGLSTGLGSNVVLSVGAASTTPLQCQWSLNGSPLVGATSLMLSLTNVQYVNFGAYALALSNAFGVVTSQTALVTTELTPEVLWTLRLGSTSDDRGLATAVDAATNVCVAGVFSGTVAFGASNLVSSGGLDIFLAKFNAAGSLLWAVKAGGTGPDTAPGLAVDAAGNIFLTGTFSGAASFGTSNLVSSGVLDCFVAKYDGVGNLLWVKRAGGSQNDQATSVATDPAGNAYVTGSYYSSATFGGIGLTNLLSTNFFLAKYDPSGNVAWAKTVTGQTICQGSGVALDSATNVYVTGYLLGSANFGSGVISNTNGYYRATVFIAKYDCSGTLQWAKKGGTNGLGWGQAIVADAYGYVYATSYKPDYGTFVFLTKYDAEGNVLWYRTAAISCCTSDYIAGYGLALDAAGNPVVTGGESGYGSFEGLGLNRQGFVVKYRASDGAPFWIQKLGSMGQGVALDDADNAYLTGSFTLTSVFGSSSNLVSAGGNDAFLVKFGVRPPLLTPAQTNLLVVAGSNATLHVVGASGTGPFAYQWQLNGSNLAGMTGSSISLGHFGPGDAGRYSVILQNTSGSVTGYVGAVGLVPVLSAMSAGNGLVLAWPATFTLQSAEDAAGPYADLPLAASPFTISFSATEPQRFFRLRVGNPAVTGGLIPNDGFAVTVAGSPGHVYAIQASTNLWDWEPLRTDAAPFSVLDTNAMALPQRFYRAFLVP
ncbi:MAG TPA: immunoglobulin domain-containing protein [Verrucomicrobiota bacterium]|nr:immunoglobulin domain-containing protein [Verrucomicrobiota bacterium]HQL79183.1 immunoglobulin domain-containing protein [Verrucomicrobiota bacterium]